MENVVHDVTRRHRWKRRLCGPCIPHVSGLSTRVVSEPPQTAIDAFQVLALPHVVTEERADDVVFHNGVEAFASPSSNTAAPQPVHLAADDLTQFPRHIHLRGLK